jgi:predicted kinase
MARTPILHLICGLPAAGKTTLAKSIVSATGGIRFSPDEWIKRIWTHSAEMEGNRFRDQVEQLQWKIAKDILRSSIDVIIEWGTWGKDEREKLRDEARAIGAKVKFYYLDVPKEVLKERIILRNRNPDQNEEFFIPENEIESFLENCFNSLQVPTREELATYDYLG